MSLAGHYVLDSDHAPRGPFEFDHPQVLEFWEKGIDARRVAREQVGDYEVSTVFLTIDHCFWGGSPPILFETMIFAVEDGEANLIDLYCDRYSTWDEAKAGHERVVAELRAGKTPNRIEASS